MANWKTVKIGEACELLTGGTPSRQNPEYFGGNIRWLVSGDVNQKQIFECDGRITALGLENSNARLLPKNSVMIALAGQGKTRGTVAILRVEAACNQSMVCMAPKEPGKLMPEFLYYNLHGRYQEIRRLTGDDGNDRRGLNMGIISNIEIPLPPLAEQKRIVALLDEAFVSIDKAKAKAEHAIKGYDELSKGMADRLLFPVDSTHPNKALGEVVEIARGGSPRPIQSYFTEAADGINWIKISDATASGKFIYKTAQKIKPSGLKKTRLVKPGDFLLSNSMSFGRPYIMKTTGCIHDGWLVLSGVERQLDQDYLYHVLGSSSVYAQFDRLAAGSTVRNLNSESASKVSIPVPPISRQKEIAEKLDHAQEVITAAKKLASMKYEALNSLQTSLLAQAFAGELTA